MNELQVQLNIAMSIIESKLEDDVEVLPTDCEICRKLISQLYTSI